jgi:hypothetical protein
MGSEWIFAVGVITVFGVVGALIFLCGPKAKDHATPWEIYHRTLNDAQAARGQFLRSGFAAASRSLKSRICCRVRKWHIALCPLCCAAR